MTQFKKLSLDEVIALVDLSKYDTVKIFTAGEWADAITQRLEIQIQAHRDEYRPDGEGHRLLLEMMKAPANPPHIEMLPTMRESVRDMNVANMQDEAALLQHDSFKNIPATTLPNIWDEEKALRGIHHDEYAHVEIDLDTPNKHLIEDFTRWLKSKRKKVTTISPVKMHDWTEQCLLPFIDLELLCKYHGHAISHQEMGKLLFPDEYNVGLKDRIGNTVKPNSKELLDIEVIRRLRAQSTAIGGG
ncbi:hypothetical protein BOW37_07730 [Solemya velum gill symbiont]|nr:DUF6387 family protein [Solemya velum gill symbiont]OOZ44261.1 hypothetical protein BOW37_07730 [Solemya velum gill symbiont]OOZ47890.1 hypothetical protein BOW39_12745 [Solemya velum gill symbiont]OOZ48026.1 hypothetical protein BOW38_00755 [Solemya velum gill symbiont]OOZ52968.1 hypothetical protein BOW40_00755 [Solemya velum gill symbiont]OOZ55599.1 hypothetical protein BOW42_09525 [Solemya velum gill symbiont]